MRLQQAPAAPTAAQTSTGRVSGTVYDQTGAVIPGVLITLAGEQKQQRDTVTNVSGAFNFTQIDPGKYTLQWHLPGFQTSPP
jgi:protocatechuate 3,4-dioxygenase beta subunit